MVYYKFNIHYDLLQIYITKKAVFLTIKIIELKYFALSEISAFFDTGKTSLAFSATKYQYFIKLKVSYYSKF